MTNRLTILYGSQTGTAQEISEKIWKESKYYGFSGPVSAMDDYNIQNLLSETVVIFICSTTGQGDQPDNMKRFWKFLLRKSLPNNLLQNVRFAVLGLGDSSYARYNYVSKKLNRRLSNLGARNLCDLGLADDQHDLGIDAVVYPWIKNLWNILFQLYDIKNNIEIDASQKLLPARWKTETKLKFEIPADAVKESLPNYDLFTTTCLENSRVTPVDHFQDVRLLKFRLTEHLNYSPGDVLMVLPTNSNEAVKEFFDIFSDRKSEINENVLFHITERYSDMPVPRCLQGYLPLITLVKEYWNLNVIPTRYVFELLSHFTDSDLEREKLQEFISSEGQQELFNYCNRQRRTILEVLADFPRATANISIEYFGEIFQPIRPRAFSIASSPKAHPGEIHILVAVVKYKTKLKKMRIGLCSNWLSFLQKDDFISVSVRRGSFLFPKENYVPVIMIGPGTGIAPFRSYVHEDADDNQSKNDLYVFFGCRNRNADFYFEDEWLQLQKNGRISLFTAFSRDQPHKIYVQDLIEQNSSLVFDILQNPKSMILVAGNAKNMPNAIRLAFKNILAKSNSDKEAEHFIATMEVTGRYQTETWS